MSNIKDFISIILPVYNVEKYLTNTIESVINQEYKNIEIILIDDGSTDMSGKICDIYAKQNDNVKVYHQTNKGVSAARNKGLELAKGEYIVFVDADDIVTPKYISELYNDIKSNNIDMVSHMYRTYFNNKNNTISIKENLNKIMSRSEFLEFIILGGRDTSSCAKIYKKDIIDMYNIKFNESITNLEDMLFIFQYIMHTGYIKISNKSNYKRIVRKDGVTFSKFNTDKLSALKVFDIIDENIRELNNISYININKVNKLKNILYFLSETILAGKMNEKYSIQLKEDAIFYYDCLYKILDYRTRIKYICLIYFPPIYKIIKYIKKHIGV